jgi:hypothetical protein
MYSQQNFNFQFKNSSSIFFKNLFPNSLLKRLQTLKIKRSYINEISEFFLLEVDNKKKSVNDLKMSFQIATENSIHFYLKKLKLIYLSFDFEKIPNFFYYPFLFNIIFSNNIISFGSNSKHYLFVRDVIILCFLDNRYIILLKIKFKNLKINFEKIRELIFFFLELQKNNVSNFILKILSKKNQLVLNLNQDKKINSQKKGCMKLDYARILTKNFVNNLDNCSLNPTSKIFEKKQEQSVTSYRAVVSYGKLKLLNRIEILSKLFFSKKEFLNKI